MDRAHTTSYAFDDRNIQWNPVEVPGFGLWPGFEFSMLAADRDLKLVEFLIKFPPMQEQNGQVSNAIFPHRHCAKNNLFVIAGEHRIYETDLKLREVRKVGSNTISYNPNDIHREGGGPDGAVIYYSVRGKDGDLFEVVEDDGKVLGVLKLDDFVALAGG
jgi:hypothetical protein